MSHRLKGLTYDRLWTSHLGCIKGCLDYLGRDVSRGWLFGGTSHAFVLNIHDNLCPSGPTAWRSEAIHRLAPNLGFRTSGITAFRGQTSTFAAKQAEAWDHVRSSLDAGTPCYAWNLQSAEYDVIHGYDEVGYYYSGPDCDGAGPKPWQEVGTDEIGVLEVYSVALCEPATDDKVVRDALSTALAYARTPEEWSIEGRTFGPRAYETWATALDTGTAARFGLGYNAAVWAECRREAVAFLQEAAQRLPSRTGTLLEEATGQFEVVRDRVAVVSELQPFRPDPAGESEGEFVESAEGAALLREAGSAELAGLAALEKLVASA